MKRKITSHNWKKTPNDTNIVWLLASIQHNEAINPYEAPCVKYKFITFFNFYYYQVPKINNLTKAQLQIYVEEYIYTL